MNEKKNALIKRREEFFAKNQNFLPRNFICENKKEDELSEDDEEEDYYPSKTVQHRSSSSAGRSTSNIIYV